MSKYTDHQKFLIKMGVHPTQIKAKKKVLKEEWNYDLSTPSEYPLSNNIPSNGTKSPNMDKARFSNENYIIAPAYSKGAYQLISKEDIKAAGKKL